MTIETRPYSPPAGSDGRPVQSSSWLVVVDGVVRCHASRRGCAQFVAAWRELAEPALEAAGGGA